MAISKNEAFDNLGLESKISGKGLRALNKDGTFNVIKENVPFREKFNFFHWLISISWLHFFGLLILGYFVVNLIFASIYMEIGIDHLTGIDGMSTYDKFLGAFFFSAQTITTLGYGRVAPIGTPANVIAATESLMGLLAFALATGMLYGRFSKPSARIMYSEHAVIAPYLDINGFMFRVVNPQHNELLEVEINVSLSIKRENSTLRNFYQLELERPKVVFFPAMWTVVHPINKSSPLYKWTEKDLHVRDVEFIVMIKAFDESFSQTVYSRSSYKADEIRWAQKFVYAGAQDKDRISIDVGMIDESEPAILNT
jgi:inward rectifier potassium channel